ncbi:Sec-independent protein translocase subunit TatA [Arthrobacter sp.]|uniref:Sec-independent protein translocase subunit TatA n=1 Tax=Arthrobacter sp. TaxID=1667 RepID=UPI003A8D4394
MGGLQGWHIVIIVVLALILFGAPKLPGLARSLGQSMRIFKSEVRQMKDDDPKAPKDPKDPYAADEPVEGKVVDPDHRGPQL